MAKGTLQCVMTSTGRTNPAAIKRAKKRLLSGNAWRHSAGTHGVERLPALRDSVVSLKKKLPCYRELGLVFLLCVYVFSMCYGPPGDELVSSDGG